MWYTVRQFAPFILVGFFPVKIHYLMSYGLWLCSKRIIFFSTSQIFNFWNKACEKKGKMFFMSHYVLPSPTANQKHCSHYIHKYGYFKTFNIPYKWNNRPSITYYKIPMVTARALIIIITISVLPKGRSFTANSGTKAVILLKGRSSIANSGTYVAVLLGLNRCGSFPLFSAPHSLFSI